MIVSPNILANKYQNLKKLRQGFVDEGALITTTRISFCHWKTVVLFYLQNNRPENVFFILAVGYHKIVQKKDIMPSKTTTNWLFTYIRCYLFIACFHCKIGIFQKTVLRVYYIINFGFLQSLSYGKYCSILPNFVFQN